MRVCVELMTCAQVLGCSPLRVLRSALGFELRKWRFDGEMENYRNGELVGFDLIVLCFAFRGSSEECQARPFLFIDVRR